MVKNLIEKLNQDHRLPHQEWATVFRNYTQEDAQYAQEVAREIAVRNFGKTIYFRGIVEYSNICKNDCY